MTLKMNLFGILSVTLVTLGALITSGASAASDAGTRDQAEVFITNAAAPELAMLAEAFTPDESEYGAGPMENAARTLHVSPQGSDTADGSVTGAWRTLHHAVRQLRAGDTLLVGEGIYYEPETLNIMGTPNGQLGAPGSPIRIWSAPGARVLITGAKLYNGFQPTPGAKYTYETEVDGDMLATIWESDTQIMLQYAGFLDRVDELPGTYWLDQENKKLYVRFSDSRGPETHGVRMRGPLVGMNIQSSYIHVKGLWFANYSVGIHVRPLRGHTIGDHVTIEECAVFSTDMAGFHVQSTSRCLFKNNYGEKNGERGSFLLQNVPGDKSEMADNLIIGNLLRGSAPTVRSSSIQHYYCIHHWLGEGVRTHLINNILDDALSCWYKPMHRSVVVQGNVMRGAFNSEGGTRRFNLEDERIVVRNNILMGGLGWTLEQFGPGGVGADWVSPRKAFVNNLRAGFGSERFEAAHFADPAYDDYRLQSDSPLRGQGVGGSDRGAFAVAPEGRIFYVGPEGDDAAEGTCVAAAFRTLQKAVEVLQPGDTLYIMSDDWSEPLAPAVAGNPDQPVRIRAYGRQSVVLPGITVAGAHIELEGFTVASADGDGIIVTADDVQLLDILVYGCSGAGIRADNARRLVMRNCTLANNNVNLWLAGDSSDAQLRDSVIGAARDMPVRLMENAGLRGANNCYAHPGPASGVAGELDSRIADPLFVNEAENDYSLRWDSPAAYLAAFARPAGAMPVGGRPIEITAVNAGAILPDSAIVTWQTPVDDTFGEVEYRLQGEVEWQTMASAGQGTLHGVGLVELQGDSEYEFRVIATGRRGGQTTSAVVAFRTVSELPPPMTYYMDPAGDDNADGLTPATAWRTMRRVCHVVAPGDTVLIAPGTYNDAIIPLRGGLPDRRLTFRRNGDGMARLHGNGVVAPLVRFAGLNHVTVDGLTFDIGVGLIPRGYMPPHILPGGVFSMSYCDDIEILNCRGGSDRRLGGGLGSNFINAGACTRLRIENCVSWGARYHLWFTHANGLILRNNTFVSSQIVSFIWDRNSGGELQIFNNIWHGPYSPKKNNEVMLFRGADLENFQSDYNLFYSPLEHQRRIGVFTDAQRKPFMTDKDLADWQSKTGQDAHSIQADAMFVDIKAGDFRLRPGSPAIGAGKDGVNIGALPVADMSSEP